MKKFVMALSLVTIALVQLKAQVSGNFSIVTNNNVTLPCGQQCTTLRASVSGSGQTTAYTVGQIAYNPPSAFNVGTAIPLDVDDKWSSTITLPFSFCFFNNSYNQLVASDNGVVSFNIAQANAAASWAIPAQGIPYAALPDRDEANAIMGPWQDMDGTNQGTVQYFTGGAAPNRYFGVSWYNMAMFGDDASINSGFCSLTDHQTQMIVLYETSNIIDIYINEKQVICNNDGNTDNGQFPNGYWNNGWAVEGIQNATGTVAYTVPGRNATQWSATNDAWRFTPSGAPDYSLTWFQGATQLGTGDSIQVCPLAPAAYRVQATISQCSAANIVLNDTIQVSLPQASITAGGPTTFCNGGSVKLTADTGAAYKWSNGRTTRSITVKASGSFTVTVTNAAGCALVSPPAVVKVEALPKATITATDSAILCNGNRVKLTANAGSGYTYAWSTGATTRAITVKNAGSYVVTVTNANKCSEASAPAVVKLCTGLVRSPADDPTQDNKTTSYSNIPTSNDGTFNVSVYPNPYTGQFHLKVSGTSDENIGVKTYDINGRLIEENKDLPAGNDIVLGQTYAAGVYLLQIKQGESAKQLRVVKQE